MAKSFEDFQAKPENFSDFEKHQLPENASLFVDDTSPEELRRRDLLSQAMTFLSSTGLSFLTAPFVVAQISLQLSPLAKKNKLSGPNPKDLQQSLLEKIPQEFSPQEKRRYELMIRSGVLGYNKPYIAPNYASYKEAFQGLANQGLLGFYKGNLLGLLHIWTNSFLRFQVFNIIESQKIKALDEAHYLAKGALEVGVLTLVDIMTHPIQLMQSRFILQNRLPNFSLYKSPLHFLRMHFSQPRTMLQGFTVHLPKNLLFTVGQYNLFPDRPFEGFLVSNLVSQAASYPLMTILRRLHCQDKLPGMLEPRYKGAFDAFKTILKEEGVRGFYRGFLAFGVVQTFSTLLVLAVSSANDMVPGLDM